MLSGAILSGFLRGFSDTYVGERQRQDAENRKHNAELSQFLLERSLTDPDFTPTPEMGKIIDSVYGKQGHKIIETIRENYRNSPAGRAHAEILNSLAAGGGGGPALTDPSGARLVDSTGTALPARMPHLDEQTGRPATPILDQARRDPLTALALFGPQAGALIAKTRGQDEALAAMQGALGAGGAGGGGNGLREGTSLHLGPLTVHGLASDADIANRAALRKEGGVLGEARARGYEGGAPATGGGAPATGGGGVLPIGSGGAPTSGAGSTARSPGEFLDQQKADAAARAQKAKRDATPVKSSALWVFPNGETAKGVLTYGQADKAQAVEITPKAAENRALLRTSLPLLKRMERAIPQLYPTDDVIGQFTNASVLAAKRLAKNAPVYEDLQTVNRSALHLVRNILNEKGNLRGNIMEQAQQNLFGMRESKTSAQAKLAFWRDIFTSAFTATNAPLPREARPLLKTGASRDDFVDNMVPDDARQEAALSGAALAAPPPATAPQTFRSGVGSYTIEGP